MCRIPRRLRAPPDRATDIRRSTAAPAGRCSEFSIPGASSRGPSHRAWLAAYGRYPAEPAPPRPLRAPSQPRVKSVLLFSLLASLHASGLDYIVRGRRQNRRPVRRTLFFLYFQFRSQNRGRRGGNGNGSRFRAAIAIKNLRCIARRDDLRQRGQRRADNIHSPHQFIRPPVGINLVDHQRQYLERLRLPASGERKSAGDVVDQQPKRLALRFDQFNQLGAELRVGYRLAALHDQVALPRNRRCAELPPAVAVRTRKPDQRRPRHLEILQHAVIHQSDALRRHTFIIKLVVAQKVLPPKLFHGRVVGDAQKIRQDLLPHFFRKRLSFGYILLPVAFGAMAKNFVEKHRRGASGQQCRPDGRVVDGRGNQSFQLLAHRRLRCIHRFVVRRVLGVDPVEIVVAVDVHAVRRLALDEQLQPVTNLPELQLRPFAGHVKGVLPLRRERHDGIDDRRRFAKSLGISADFLFPWLAVHGDGNLRPDKGMGFFPRKIRRAPFRGFYFYFLARLDLDQRLGSGAVLFVGLQQ